MPTVAVAAAMGAVADTAQEVDGYFLVRVIMAVDLVVAAVLAVAAVDSEASVVVVLVVGVPAEVGDGGIGVNFVKTGMLKHL